MKIKKLINLLREIGNEEADITIFKDNILCSFDNIESQKCIGDIVSIHFNIKGLDK